ncbi:hypothetical protein [Bifidobacterium biavatii]|uniref:Putative lipoprotein n=1 Tax=Bifidobacterium biavatii DSM 23969 TaxID=1437608 RepID=A0A086ZQY8_9BIFI|nr:hypothetical protein [Bifidobacterium biavatii]KFI48938.1 putative lipoprotein [Bifidobacterium biavatii DSM 23969]
MKKTIALLAATAMLIGLAACGTTSATTGNDDGSTTTQQQEKPKPADLTGTWKQTNSKSDDSWMEATISGDSIEINWVGQDTKSLYWKGSYEAPSEAGDWKWTSKGDTETMKTALMTSQDDTKDFAYSADKQELTYEASMLGTTMTIRMSKQ